jgi:hypothetical protein
MGGFSNALLDRISGPGPAPVAQVNPLDQQEKQQAIAESTQAQQLNAQKIEEQKMLLDDQKTLRSLQPQFVTKDESGKPTGYDWNGLISAAQGKVMPATLFSLQKQQSDMRQSLATANKDELDNQDRINKGLYERAEGLKGITDPNQRQQEYEKALDYAQKHGVDVNQWPAAAPDNDHLSALEAGFGMHAQALADQKTQAETQAQAANATESTAKAANQNTEAALNQIKLNLAKNSKPGDFDAQIDSIFPPSGLQSGGTNRMMKAQVNAALQRGDLDGARKYIDQALESQLAIQKDVAVAKQTQPLKIETARAEQQAAQLIKGMSEPVYAYDAKGQKTLMSKTDALQSGLKTMVPVTEKEIGDDTMLLNRLGDVHQKIARYENAMQKWPMSYNDRTALQSLLASDKFKLGAFGAEIPVDSFNKLADQLHVKNLSAPARDALISYYNAREAMVGYNRVLSGSGKSSDKALELQEQTLPDITTADHDMAARGFRDFKENLNVVGQGLPKLPGVKSPEEWAQQSAPKPVASQAAPKPATGWGTQFGGVAH